MANFNMNYTTPIDNESTILIRSDSSSTIGTGHIMRDLVLAQQFSDANIIFATQDLDGNINAKIEEHNYPIKLLKSNDKEELSSLIKSLHVSMLIIDHYSIDERYEKYIKDETGVTLFVLDDTYEKHHCDILLNHNISADVNRYKELVPTHCELRCGSKYTLLREEFIAQKKQPKPKSSDIKNVFIAMGGADHSNQNINILKVLQSFEDIHAHLVTTTANQHLKELQEFVKGRRNISLHVNSSHLAKLMHEVDFAIATPSVTINEIIYMELPFIAIKSADNQKEIFEYLQQNNYLVLESFDADKLQNMIEVLL